VYHDGKVFGCVDEMKNTLVTCRGGQKKIASTKKNDFPDLNCQSWVIMDGNTGKTLFGSANVQSKVSEKRALPIASVSKILTFLVCISSIDNERTTKAPMDEDSLLSDPALMEKVKISPRTSTTTGTSARLKEPSAPQPRP